MIFSLSFAALFLVAAGLRFLAIRLDGAGAMFRRPVSALADIIAAGRWALSLALYGGILLGLSYAVRDKVFAPAAALLVGVLGLGFTYGIAFALDSWERVPPEREFSRPLGEPGLILTSPRRPGGTAVVLLQEPSDPDGARVVAVPGQPLQYQPEFAGRDPLSTPLELLEDGNPWFLRSLAIDLQLNANRLNRLFAQGLEPFMVYTGALIFLLCALSFIMKMSAWPLVSLFLGCLAFRGVLSLEVFFNSPEMQEAFGSFLQDRLEPEWATPLIFGGFGLLVYLYSFLVFLARRQSKNEN